jgi:hypothetical protein
MIYPIVLRKGFATLVLALPVLFLQGCLATQDWVREQLTPQRGNLLPRAFNPSLEKRGNFWRKMLRQLFNEFLIYHTRQVSYFLFSRSR